MDKRKKRYFRVFADEFAWAYVRELTVTDGQHYCLWLGPLRFEWGRN